MAAELGFNETDPSIVQPAQVYFDLLSDDLRRRVFIVSEAMSSSEAQQVLRPEFTIAIAQQYLHEAVRTETSKAQRYSYSGPIFRANPQTGDCEQVQQTGVEIFGQKDDLKTEVEVIEYALKAIELSNIKNVKLVLGDYSLFYAILDQLNISAGWLKKIKRLFLSKNNLDEMLAQLKLPLKPAQSKERTDFLEMINSVEPAKARMMVENMLNLNGMDVIAGRTVEEISSRFLEQADELSMPMLSEQHISIIEDFFKINCDANAIVAELTKFAQKYGLKLEPNISKIEKLIDAILGLKLDELEARNVEFNSFLGRSFEYYTGMVFEIIDQNNKVKAPLIGGGRYDNLVNHLDDQFEISAVGASLWNERICNLMDGEAK